jgi:hypothetical protein
MLTQPAWIVLKDVNGTSHQHRFSLPWHLGQR